VLLKQKILSILTETVNFDLAPLLTAKVTKCFKMPISTKSLALKALKPYILIKKKLHRTKPALRNHHWVQSITHESPQSPILQIKW
jgi:hypothetical protein